MTNDPNPSLVSKSKRPHHQHTRTKTWTSMLSNVPFSSTIAGVTGAATNGSSGSSSVLGSTSPPTTTTATTSNNTFHLTPLSNATRAASSDNLESLTMRKNSTGGINSSSNSSSSSSISGSGGGTELNSASPPSTHNYDDEENEDDFRKMDDRVDPSGFIVWRELLIGCIEKYAMHFDLRNLKSKNQYVNNNVFLKAVQKVRKFLFFKIVVYCDCCW